VPLESKELYLTLLTDIMNTQLHITCVLTGKFEYHTYYWTRVFSARRFKLTQHRHTL